MLSCRSPQCFWYAEVFCFLIGWSSGCCICDWWISTRACIEVPLWSIYRARNAFQNCFVLPCNSFSEGSGSTPITLLSYLCKWTSSWSYNIGFWYSFIFVRILNNLAFLWTSHLMNFCLRDWSCRCSNYQCGFYWILQFSTIYDEGVDLTL
jgi:hypothetical protein